MLLTPGTPVSAWVRPVPDLPGSMAEQDLVGNNPSIFLLRAAITESQRSMTLHGLVTPEYWLRVVKLTLYLASNGLLSDELAK